MARHAGELQGPGGLRSQTFQGFSWTTFFWGPFPALFRGDMVGALAGLLSSLFFWYPGTLVWAFLYNGFHRNRLLERGYVPATFGSYPTPGTPSTLPPRPPAPPPPGSDPAWAADPFGRNESRWHDGREWTEHVATAGIAARDSAQYAPPEGGTIGWTADPYCRFDRRYFDGTSWTEHVSNAPGSSQTDPPIVTPPKTDAVASSGGGQAAPKVPVEAIDDMVRPIGSDPSSEVGDGIDSPSADFQEMYSAKLAEVAADPDYRSAVGRAIASGRTRPADVAKLAKLAAEQLRRSGGSRFAGLFRVVGGDGQELEDRHQSSPGDAVWLSEQLDKACTSVSSADDITRVFHVARAIAGFTNEMPLTTAITQVCLAAAAPEGYTSSTVLRDALRDAKAAGWPNDLIESLAKQ